MKKLKYLKNAEHAEVHGEAGQQVALLVRRVVLHPLARPVVDRGRDEHDADEPRVDPAVEEVAGREQQEVLPAVRQPPVDRDHDQEEDDEVEAVEDHRNSGSSRRRKIRV